MTTPTNVKLNPWIVHLFQAASVGDAAVATPSAAAARAREIPTRTARATPAGNRRGADAVAAAEGSGRTSAGVEATGEAAAAAGLSTREEEAARAERGERVAAEGAGGVVSAEAEVSAVASVAVAVPRGADAAAASEEAQVRPRRSVDLIRQTVLRTCGQGPKRGSKTPEILWMY